MNAESKIRVDLHYAPCLEALSKDDIPTVLVAAKSDNPRGSWEVDHDMGEELTGIESFPVASSTPETHKRCISILLRNVIMKRRGELPSLSWFIHMCLP